MSEQENASPPVRPESNDAANGSVMMAVIVGLIAAMVGGGIWGWLTLTTGYEIGYVALGVGLLCGLAIVKVANGKGMVFQVIAVLCSLIGVLVGKYVIFFYNVKEVWTEQYGAAEMASFTLFSAEAVQEFTANASLLFGGYNILWVVLAVGAAWRTTQE